MASAATGPVSGRFATRDSAPSLGATAPGRAGAIDAAGVLRAEAAAARLPALIVAAERVAATIMGGVHGRRRAGSGDAFWQFRPYVPGDDATRVDWRQSGKSDRVFVRETEWEAAQTVALWRDPSEGMIWTGDPSRPTKRDRADLLLLALSSLLLRGGERVRLIGGGRGVSGRSSLATLAARLGRLDGPPVDQTLPRHARAVLFGDFLGPLPDMRDQLSGLASSGLATTLVVIADPAEESLPYAGRVRFEPLGGGLDDIALVPRVEGIRELYQERLAAHRAGLAALAASLGMRLLTHRTDAPAGAALLALWQALAPAGAR
ncbi:DUF58 domain-containing protein [Roseomonas sp. CCTCC AB2023176]|uniref:DUF58 domain-containing protein n=1 Tax=Roseomonas sp. CCTCC AB2023176 TaxID=3342640 RepID=UPI0035E07A43